MLASNFCKKLALAGEHFYKWKPLKNSFAKLEAGISGSLTVRNSYKLAMEIRDGAKVHIPATVVSK